MYTRHSYIELAGTTSVFCALIKKKTAKFEVANICYRYFCTGIRARHAHEKAVTVYRCWLNRHITLLMAKKA